MPNARREIPQDQSTQAPAEVSDALDAALEMTFPASDPVAISATEGPAGGGPIRTGRVSRLQTHQPLRRPSLETST
jgi:hypothetical protein